MDQWVESVEKSVEAFAKTYKIIYARNERELSASFEIGCLHALTDFYESSCLLTPKNLINGKFRYLTTPSGNPDNFSYIEAKEKKGKRAFEIRQQVRVRSHLDSDIAFTPDMVVLRKKKRIKKLIDPDYASGKRGFFFVNSSDVIAAHECKSMNPFPELLVSFIGMVVAAHSWLKKPLDRSKVQHKGLHLAPSLFVGGSASGVHYKMVQAMERTMPLNIILGLHRGSWNLLDSAIKRNRIEI